MAEELLLSRFERAWNQHDHDGCAACFTAEGVRDFRVRRRRALRGRAAIARHAARLMAAVPDLSVEVLAAGYCSDRRLWTEWRLRGTPSDGAVRRFEVLGVSVFRLSNAGFEEERLYWDPALTAPPRTSRARRARS